MDILLRDGRVWLALWALINAVVLAAWPELPQPILAAADALVGVIVGALAGVAARRAVVARRRAVAQWRHE